MRFILALFFATSLFASSYNFDEYKYVSAADVSFKKSGKISFEKNKTTITYRNQKFIQIVSYDKNVSIEG